MLLTYGQTAPDRPFDVQMIMKYSLGQDPKKYSLAQDPKKYSFVQDPIK